jgi:hypothetical protein
LKIIESTPTTLALRRTPILIWLICLSALVMGIVLTLILGKQYVLECQRLGSGGTCQLATRNLFGSGRVETFPLSDLQGASVEISPDSEGDDTYRLSLRINGENQPLSPVYSSGFSKKDALAQSINSFISDSRQPGLSVRQDERFLGMLAGGICALTALALAAFLGQVVTLRLDRSTGTVTLKRMGLLGVREGEYLLSDFTDAVLEYGENTSRIALVTRDGGHLPLTSEFTSGSRGKEATAATIRAFLKPGNALTPLE